MNASNDIQPDRLAADESAIRARIDGVMTALHATDLDAVGRAYTPDVISFDVEPPLQHVGIEAKLANWAKVFQFFDTVTYDVRDLILTVGADVAYGHAFARLSGTTKSGDRIPGMWVRVTYGLRKFDNTWLIAHDQVSVPFDVATGTSAIDLRPE
ncbi:YybH family protein [Nocardia sp. NPDC004582]